MISRTWWILSAYSSPMRLKVTYWRTAAVVMRSKRPEVGIAGAGAGVCRTARRAVREPYAALLERTFAAAPLVEGGDQVPQRMRLSGHLLGRRGELLGRGGAPLGDLVDLAHRPVDLLDAGGLLVGAGRDLLDQLGGLADRRQKLAQQGARVLGDPNAGGRQLADLLGCRLAALGELPDLAGHHREAASVIAGARRLDGGVQ